jgi:tetratricopeptide (TPR) repeat protein
VLPGMTIAIALLALPPAARAQPTTRSAVDERLDAAEFRRGLEKRGLTELLELYDRQRQASQTRDINARLAERERLLDVCTDIETDPAARKAACDDATAILGALIAKYPDHPQRLRWQTGRARDYAERHAAPAIEGLLFRVASPAQREEVRAAATKALAELAELKRVIAAEWERVDKLPPKAFAALAEQNGLAELEAVEARTQYLIAWANLYLAMVAPPGGPERAGYLATTTEILDAHEAWLTTPHDQTGLQIQALLVAGIAARLQRDFPAADKDTQQAVQVYARLTDPDAKQAMERWALLAVLERIRLLIDQGYPDDAAAAVDRAYAWVANTSPEDVTAVTDLAILERSLDQAHAARAVERLTELAHKSSPAVRDVICESLGVVVLDGPPDAPLRPLERLALASVLTERADQRDRAADLLNQTLDETDDPVIESEALLRLAQCHAARGQRLAAVDTFLRLVDAFPESDRAVQAAEGAVALARDRITDANASSDERRRATDAFARAVNALRRIRPEHPHLNELTYVAGVALEQAERWADAAEAFAQVAGRDRLVAQARLHRAVCCVRLFEAQPAADTARVAQAAATEASDAWKALSPANRDPCQVGRAQLLEATVLVHPAVGEPDAALERLRDFEDRFADCADLVGTMWQIRLRAVKQQGRLAAAADLVDKMLAADPAGAGPVMRELLASLLDRVEQLRRQGDTEALRDVAADAADVAERLETWARKRTPEAAESIRLAGQPDQAAQLVPDGGSDGAAPDPAWRFVRAEGLYHAGRYRDALPMYHDVVRAAERRSTLWWRALLRNLQCHVEIKTDPAEIRQSIAQHRAEDPEMGGAALRDAFDALEARLAQPPKTAD